MTTAFDTHAGCTETGPGEFRTVAFRTIGCKLNQCETAQMQEALLARGYRLVGWDQTADIRVVNTCTVTAKSDRTCRHEIRLAKRLDPESTVVVTGCYAQIDPQAVAAIPGVDLVLGNLDKPRLVDHLAGLHRPANGAADSHANGAADGAADGPVCDSDPARHPTLSVSSYPDHAEFEGEFFSHFYGYTRAFLKVQTGCDSRCAYCIIPLARGPARSMPKADVLREVGLLAGRGFREIVLTGINLGSWGRDTGEGTVADLLQALLERRADETPGAPGAGPGRAEATAGRPAGDGEQRPVQSAPPSAGHIDIGRYRLSSIEPLEVDEALMDVVESAGDRAARHFHLPLQSGSDTVLRRMCRPYSAADYLAVVSELARRFPDAAIGADVIAGFPGETEAEFQETLAFIEQAPLTYLHVFSYSDRPGTRASAAESKVPSETIHERSVRLRALGERKNASFRSKVSGTRQRVLVLKERDAAGRLVGITGNYLEVLLAGGDELMNRFAQVRLEKASDDGRWAASLLGVEKAAEHDAAVDRDAPNASGGRAAERPGGSAGEERR
jgi:threonylcarbamoyladenosine tRNA methylthiotransferase MtaB